MEIKIKKGTSAVHVYANIDAEDIELNDLPFLNKIVETVEVFNKKWMDAS